MNFIRQITFTSTQDLLQNTDIKGAISNALGLDAVAYAARLAANPVTSEKMGFRMAVDVTVSADGTLIINGEEIDVKNGVTYSSKYPIDIWQLALKTAGSGRIDMDIRR